MLLAFILLLLCFRSAGAQDGGRADGVPQPAAEVLLRVEPAKESAHLSLVVLGGTPPGRTEAEAKAALSKALAGVFGGPVHQLSFTRTTAADYDDSDEDGGGKPAGSKNAPPVGWRAEAGVGGAEGGPLRRTGLLMSGALDLRPILALLKSGGVPQATVSVFINGQPAPTRTLTGIRHRTTSARSRSRTLVSATAVFRTDAPPAQPIRFSVGWTGADLAQTYLPLLILLLVPLVLALVLRVRALKAQARYAEAKPGEGVDPRSAIWLGCFRLLHHGTFAFSLVWVAACIALQPEGFPNWLFDVQASEVRTALSFLTIALPPALIPLLGTLILRPVFARLQDTEISVGETVLQAGGNLILALLPPLFFWIGVDAALDRGLLNLLGLLRVFGGKNLLPLLTAGGAFLGGFRAFGWFALAGLVRYLLTQALPLVNKLRPIPLAVGGLRERVLALSQQAGVRVSEVVYLPTGTDRTANAFAVRGNLVVLTDRLLSELSRREIDGVIAHELGHLKFRHPLWLGVFGVLGTVLVIGLRVLLAVIHAVPPGWDSLFNILYAPVVISLGLLIHTAISRRWEVDADREAVRLTGDAAALISGLTRLSRINGSPEEWSRFEERLVTHPSTRRRAASLAAAGGLDAAELESAVSTFQESVPPEDRYPLPEDPSTPDLVFSPAARLRQTVATVYVALMILVGMPALTALLAERFFGRNPLLAVPTYLLGTGLTLVAYLTFMNRVGPRATMRLEARLRTRLRAEGQIPPTDADIAFVGLAPSGPPHLYDGRADLDRGYLVFEPDALRFVGETMRFTVPRALLVPPYSGGKSWGWFPQTRVALAWADPANGGTPSARTTVLLFTYGAPTARGQNAVSEALLARLQAWYIETTPDLPAVEPTERAVEAHDAESGEDGGEGGQVASEPAKPPVPSLVIHGGFPLSRFRDPRLAFKVARPFLMGGLAVGFLAGLPIRGILYILLVAAAIVATEVALIARRSG